MCREIRDGQEEEAPQSHDQKGTHDRPRDQTQWIHRRQSVRSWHGRGEEGSEETEAPEAVSDLSVEDRARLVQWNDDIRVMIREIEAIVDRHSCRSTVGQFLVRAGRLLDVARLWIVDASKA
jgi:hypothetical protein